jgi:hypothetical protein
MTDEEIFQDLRAQWEFADTLHIDELMSLCNRSMAAKGFNKTMSLPIDIALCHSELSEALEADRNDAQSTKLPGFTGVEEELADVLYRVLHIAAKYQLRLPEAFVAKGLFNLARPAMHGGKKY